ncbi:hypothetical protein [Sulfurimonas sp.]|uniref:hypothetical protein n=1 Tax=Sulfurimonas sp. TaxID=2022749 RepID=UPI003D1088E1
MQNTFTHQFKEILQDLTIKHIQSATSVEMETVDNEYIGIQQIWFMSSLIQEVSKNVSEKLLNSAECSEMVITASNKFGEDLVRIFQLIQQGMQDNDCKHYGLSIVNNQLKISFLKED